MLSQLSIKNYAIVDDLNIELNKGMTIITGETGAGKSIMLDALSLALGQRADSAVISPKKERAEIAASLDLNHCAEAKKWLQDNDLTLQDEGISNSSEPECLLRRVISRDGRSRAYINGNPVTLLQLKTLGGMLIDIQSQHEHQSLLLKPTQRRLLDEFSSCTHLVNQISEAYENWSTVEKQVQALRNVSEDENARLQLLRYQVEELEELALTEGEIAQLEQEQKRLIGAEGLLAASQQLTTLCYGGEENTSSTTGIIEQLSQSVQLLEKYSDHSSALSEAKKMLATALIQVEEAAHEIQNDQQSIEINPTRLEEVDKRLSCVYQIARKHKIQPENVYQLQQTLSDKLSALEQSDKSIEHLEVELVNLAETYQELAKKLSAARKTGAKKLSSAVNKKLAELNMAGCQLSVDLTIFNNEPDSAPYSLYGNETISFLIKTNPGQPFQALKKIASGGELSRISLAIQTVTALTSAIPTLIFDEVDVGVGGETAAIVGNLLRELGEKGQVICVSHQASVASKAHHHLFVTKAIEKNGVKTAVIELENKGRVEEVARMIGGETTKQSIAHAEQLLQTA